MTSLLRGERRAKDGRALIPDSSAMVTLDEDPGDDDYWNIPDEHFNIPEDFVTTYVSASHTGDQSASRREAESAGRSAGGAGLSFVKGKAPPLPSNVRTRNLDVGARIGRRPHGNAQRSGSEGLDGGAKKASAMEEQMRRIESRQAADRKLEESRLALEQAAWERGLDSIPYLPGRWTQALHEKVVACLCESKAALENAEQLYASAEAKDKISDCQELRELLQEAQLHAQNSKRAWIVLADAESALQKAAEQGWPHGKEDFERAEALVLEARQCFVEIGEAGCDDSGRARPREKMLNKRIQRVLVVRKECERRRIKVQVLLNRLSHAKWETRCRATVDIAEVGRKPLPCSVTFLGELVPLAEESAWLEVAGRGDPEVVAGVLAMRQDDEAEVRRTVVETLPRVCPQGDPLVLEAISSLTADAVNKVKITAMDALSHLCARGDPLVVTNLCSMLEDPDTAVRNLGVRLLPMVTSQPSDQLAIEEVLRRLDHKRR